MTTGQVGSTEDVRRTVAEPVPASRPVGPGGVLYRLGRWAALHPLKVLGVWIALLILAVFSAGNFASRLGSQTNAVDGSDSVAAAELVDKAFPDAPAETDFVVLHSDSVTARDAAFRALVTRAMDRYRGADKVGTVISPYDQAATLISADGHTALVPVSLTGEQQDLRSAAGRLQNLARDLDTARIRVYFTGFSALGAATVDRAGTDLERAEGIGFPAAAIVLMFAFGSVVAAAIPLTLGFTAILSAFGLLGIFAFFLRFSVITQSAVTMLAIALGIDYSLFIVTRFREELAAIDPTDRTVRAEAVGRAVATAGRAVLFSGGTVIISLAGLFVVRSSGIRAMAVGMMAGVFAMMLLALTLLPAILGLLGRRVNSLALPWARRSLDHPDPEHSWWARLTGAVMRRPVLVAAGVAAVLAVLAAPALGLRFGVDTGAGAVKDSPAGRGFTVLSTAFAPGVLAPVTVVASGDGALTDRQLDAVADVSRRAAADGRVAAVSSITTVLDQRLGGHGAQALRAALGQAPDAFGSLVNKSGDTTVVTIYPKQAADSGTTQALVASLRGEVRRAFAGTGAEAHVGGSAAQINDIMAENSRATPLVIAAVLAASWLLLFFVFRSLVLPFKAILVNLLSVGAAFGVVVLVFQQGHGARLLGVDRTGFIQVMLPLLTFAVAFGLSMDYEVFMVSRMREEWDRTGDNAAAVRLGITYTGRVITSAALIMVVVFAAFVLGSMVEGKQLGFMLAVAVLIDATIVRLFLVPALMRIMGRWNWWVPGWVRRLAPPPRI